jgi:hypothetical protein
MATHNALLAAQLARSVANGQRYLAALRADQAFDRAARQDGQYHLPRGAQRYLSELRHPLSAGGLAQHAAPTAFVGPAPTPEEALWGNVQGTNTHEVALMMRTDPVVRATAGAVAVVGAAVVAAHALAEEAAAYGSWRWLGMRAAALRFGANATGQYVGNYALYGNSKTAFYQINWVSPYLSAAGVPLMTTAMGSAAFKISYEKGYQSILNGRVTGTAMIQDAILSYGFGQATRLSGLDNLHRSPELVRCTDGLRYQISLRLSPRFAMGLGAVMPATLEAGNRTASSAVRKVGAAELKKHLPK